MTARAALHLLRLRRAHQAIARLLGKRSQTSGPDWVCLDAINAITLRLGAGVGSTPTIQVAVRDGIPLSSIPSRWSLGDTDPVPIYALRAPRAAAHAAPLLRPCDRPAMYGTATALVKATTAPTNFLLTCAHVALPALEGSYGNLVDVTHTAAVGRGQVVDWRPALQAGPAHSRMDAALLAIDDSLATPLRGEGSMLPLGVGGALKADKRVVMRSHRGNFQGSLKVYWSGPVDIPGLTPGESDYFLDDAIGYCCDAQGGDSGAAIWDDKDHLMGMHIAGVDGVAAGEPNAVYGEIQPVLAAFNVQPWLRFGGVADTVTVPAIAESVQSEPRRNAATPAAASGSRSEQEIVACTIWGEARNQGEEGMRAVACVIGNRWRTGYRHRQTASDVCLDPWQFSCWLKGDPNLPRMLAVARAPDAQFQIAANLADQLLQGTLQDITQGARHYYACSMRRPPNWAQGKYPCVVIGDHLFFNNVA